MLNTAKTSGYKDELKRALTYRAPGGNGQVNFNKA